MGCHKEKEKETEDGRVSKADVQMKREESHAAGNKGIEKQNIAFVLLTYFCPLFCYHFYRDL